MTTNVNRYFFCFLFLILPLTNALYAQIVIGTPSLGFSQICANSSFTSFNVSFTFSLDTQLNASNQFIVELSDATGNFNNATIVYTSNPGTVKTSPAILTFQIPTTIFGEKYKLRIKSTSPATNSPSSAAFAAYYKIQDSPFSINNFNATASYCSGGSYILTIDNPGTGSNDSPLKYPSLTYNWYKEASPNPVLVSTGSSLTVSQPGTYYVETNYGTCTSNSYSNRVTVNEVNSGATSTISSSLGNPFCSSSPTILSTNSGNSYQWYKNNVAISGANSQTYLTSQVGNYSVAINYGSCSATASIDLKNYDFTSSINVPTINTVSEGETLNVIVTTDASNPDYKWYLNGSVIPGVTTSTYDATTTGSYKVVITQTTGCNSSTEIPFELRYTGNADKIPNIISLSSSSPFNVWDIPSEYKNPKTRVLIMNSTGVISLDTYDYQSDWPKPGALDFKNVNPVFYYVITSDNVQKKGSITIIK